MDNRPEQTVLNICIVPGRLNNQNGNRSKSKVELEKENMQCEKKSMIFLIEISLLCWFAAQNTFNIIFNINV